MEQVVTFQQALRNMRRKVYVFPDEWRVLVLSSTHSQLTLAFDEAVRCLEAGSLRVAEANRLTHIIRTERGGLIKFVAMPVTSRDDGQALKGSAYTHVIWLFDGTPLQRALVASLIRSPTIAPEHLINEDATL